MRRWIFWWAVLGVCATLSQAIYRLTPLAIDALSLPLPWWQWTLAIAWVLFNLYAEGWRGFHQAFSPRVVARAEFVATHPRTWTTILAPLVAMGLVFATKKRLIVTYVLWGFIIALIIGVRFLSQPWRGIVDAGVVVGLAAGLFSILFFVVRSLQNKPPAADPDVPAYARA